MFTPSKKPPKTETDLFPNYDQDVDKLNRFREEFKAQVDEEDTTDWEGVLKYAREQFDDKKKATFEETEQSIRVVLLQDNSNRLRVSLITADGNYVDYIFDVGVVSCRSVKETRPIISVHVHDRHFNTTIERDSDGNVCIGNEWSEGYRPTDFRPTPDERKFQKCRFYGKLNDYMTVKKEIRCLDRGTMPYDVVTLFGDTQVNVPEGCGKIIMNAIEDVLSKS